MFQKSVLSVGIKILNSSSLSITSLRKESTQFKAPLTRYLSTHSVYSIWWIFYG